MNKGIKNNKTSPFTQTANHCLHAHTLVQEYGALP